MSGRVTRGLVVVALGWGGLASLSVAQLPTFAGNYTVVSGYRGGPQGPTSLDDVAGKSVRITPRSTSNPDEVLVSSFEKTFFIAKLDFSAYPGSPADDLKLVSQPGSTHNGQSFPARMSFVNANTVQLIYATTTGAAVPDDYDPRTDTYQIKLVLARVSLASAKQAMAAAKATAASFVGGYTVVSGERDGSKLPAERIKDTTVRITKDEVIVSSKDKKIYVAKYKPLSGTRPYKVTFTTVAPKEGSAVIGLIDKEGDKVKLIYALPGGDAPTSFKTKDKQLMFVLVNEKKQ